MNTDSTDTLSQDTIAAREQRKLYARRSRKDVVWFGLGMFGLVGWAVSVPMLAGLALGIFIDTRYASRYSWTLMLLIIGVVLGCLNAWYWIVRQRREIEHEQPNTDGGDL